MNDGDEGDVAFVFDNDGLTDTVPVADTGDWPVVGLPLWVVVVVGGGPPVMDVAKPLLLVVCVGGGIVLVAVDRGIALVSVELLTKGVASRQYPEA